MNTRPFEPFHVGQTLLANNQLTRNGMHRNLMDSHDFAAFVLNTSAVIGTAISQVFPDNGELKFTDKGEGRFVATAIEPWIQYSAAATSLRTDPALANVIIGWCALLSVHSHFLSTEHVEPKAIAFARYIASKGFKSAFVTPEDIRIWDDICAWPTTITDAISRLERSGIVRQSPWSKATELSLPTPPTLNHLTALDLINAFGGYILVVNGSAWAMAGSHHFIKCVDNVSHVKVDQKGGFEVSLMCGGESRVFVCHTNGKGDGKYLSLHLRTPI